MRNTSRPGTRPVRLGRALASTALGLALLSAIPAQGHPADLMKPDRAGPIVRGDATLRDLRRWFGPPTARKQVRVGCERVVSARWGGGLRVYASRERPRAVRAIFVGRRHIVSAAHGELRMHTRKGLRVGNREVRLRRLYPGAPADTHGGHTHYRIGTGPGGAYLLAKVREGRVVRLEAWPFEFC
jgi:hypothetical protein